MTLTLAIPFFNHLEQVKGIMGLLKHHTSPTTEWIIIDNGSTDPVEEFFRHTLRPKRLNYIQNKKNIGMVKTYQQIFDAVETDLVAILHNDVYIYENLWDQRIISYFESIPQLGVAGLFGSQGIGTRGERIQFRPKPTPFSGLSNMLEYEQHGNLLKKPYHPIAIMDGFAMILNMNMINKAGGLDQRYLYHHLYDRELSLMSLALGYKNIVVDVPCHHVSSLTANQPEYQAWINAKLEQDQGEEIDKADQLNHDQNHELFLDKWQSVLPLYIQDDFSYLEGEFNHWTCDYSYTGDSILKFLSK